MRWCITAAQQGRAAAGAALVEEDDVTPVAKSAEHRAHRAGKIDRALPGPAGEEEHRVRQLVARQGRHHRKVQGDLGALRLRRIERPLQLATQGTMLHAFQAARLQLAGGAAGARGLFGAARRRGALGLDQGCGAAGGGQQCQRPCPAQAAMRPGSVVQGVRGVFHRHSF
jgi:hypothetical protein